MAKFKVLLFESVHQCGLDHLEKNDCEVVWAEGFEPAQIQKAIADVDGVLARAQGFLDGPSMDVAPNLKVVGRHGIGVDNIDVPAATERGIWVLNTPNAPVEAVAEYVTMGMIALPRRIIEADAATRNDNWGFRNEAHAPELQNKTLGVVGFGRIGRRIAEICSLGFGMNVLYSDAIAASLDEEKRLKAQRVDFDDLLAQSDYISLNVPLLDSTHHMVNAAAFNRMKPNAILINCARGPVVDEAALIDALKNEKIGGAVIDVFEREPIAPDNPLLKLNNVLLSPHYSGHSQESAQNMAMVAADIVRVLQGQTPEHAVNAPETPRQPVA